VQAIIATNTVAWMGYKSGVYKSTDRGATWTLSLNGPTTSPNTGSQRWWNTRMAVSRTDPSVCLYGTLAGGVYYTTTGGASWTQVPATTVPFGASGFGIPCVAIDPAGNFYVAPTGAGVYRSTDHGATWAKVSLDTQFLTVAGMDCGPNGDVMVTAHTSATVFDETTAVVYRYRAGTWTQLTLGGSVRTWRSPAYDPLTPGQVHIKGDGGYERRSTDYGTTWTIPLHTFVSTAPDVPWLAVANGGAADFFFTTVGGLQFDPVVPNRLWKSQGIGVWYCDLPSSLTARMTWNAQSRGIEQLVVNDVFAPPGGSPLVVCWDRAIFLVGETS
jgi:hypothetical protein